MPLAAPVATNCVHCLGYLAEQTVEALSTIVTASLFAGSLGLPPPFALISIVPEAGSCVSRAASCTSVLDAPLTEVAHKRLSASVRLSKPSNCSLALLPLSRPSAGLAFVQDEERSKGNHVGNQAMRLAILTSSADVRPNQRTSWKVELPIDSTVPTGDQASQRRRSWRTARDRELSVLIVGDSFIAQTLAVGLVLRIHLRQVGCIERVMLIGY